MRRILIIISAIMMLLVISGTAIAAPRMVLPESAFDFGIVPQNAKVSHIFWIHSKGTDSLRILKVVPG